jgi:hypothetical protein
MLDRVCLLSAMAVFATTAFAVAQDNPPDVNRNPPPPAVQQNTIGHPLDYQKEPPVAYRPCPANVVTRSGRHECLG